VVTFVGRSAFGKLLFAHLAQNADSHNTVQLNFLFSVSELGFLDERELIETLDELESFGMILVQRGNSNSELVVAQLMPDFTEILSEREAKGRRKKRTRHSAMFDFKRPQPITGTASNLDEKKSAAKPFVIHNLILVKILLNRRKICSASCFHRPSSQFNHPLQKENPIANSRARGILCRTAGILHSISGKLTARRKFRHPTVLLSRFIRPDNRTTRLIYFYCRASNTISRRTMTKMLCIEPFKIN
jgi:hypothetical protein